MNLVFDFSKKDLFINLFSHEVRKKWEISIQTDLEVAGRFFCIVLAYSLIFITTLRADEFTTLDGDHYTHATLKQVEPDGLLISYPNGVVKLKFKNLPKELCAKYGYNPAYESQYLANKYSNDAAAYESILKQQGISSPKTRVLPVEPQTSDSLPNSDSSLSWFQKTLSYVEELINSFLRMIFSSSTNSLKSSSTNSSKSSSTNNSESSSANKSFFRLMSFSSPPPHEYTHSPYSPRSC